MRDSGSAVFCQMQKEEMETETCSREGKEMVEVTERERERESVCVCVCVCEKGRIMKSELWMRSRTTKKR